MSGTYLLTQTRHGFMREDEKAWRWSILLIVCNALIWFFLYSYYRHGLDNADMVEAYAWGHTWDWGNNKHPPMTGWVTNLWFSVFPTNDDSFYLLTECNLAVALTFLALAMKRFMNGYQIFFALVLTVVFSRYGFDTGYKYNANSGQLPFITGFLWASLKALTDSKRFSSWWLLTGTFAAAAVLCKYSAVLILLAIAAASVFVLRPKKNKVILGVVVTTAIATVLLMPHIMWEINHHWPSIQYMHASHQFTRADNEGKEIGHAVYDLIQFSAISILFLLVAIFKSKTTQSQIKRERIGAIIYTLSIVLTIVAAWVENITIEGTWFIVPSIFLGWFLVDLIPDDVDWLKISIRGRNLFYFYVVLLVISAVYFEVRYDKYPAPAPYALKQQLAHDITALYTTTFHDKIQDVAGTFPLPYALSFYSSDHPQGLYGIDLSESPWINPVKLRRQSKVVVCSVQQQNGCIAKAHHLFGLPATQAILNYSSYDSNHKRYELEQFKVLMYPRTHDFARTAMPHHLSVLSRIKRQVSDL